MNQVRAGRPLRPATWKNGARCAVAFSFDSDHETNELRDGGKSIGRMAWGEYGARVGVPRILAMLRKYDVPATFYVPAVAALLHSDEQRRVVAEGHEIGIHGWIHELNSVLPYAVERDLMFRATDTLEQVTGVRPVGLRTPSWDFSPSTLKIEKELGLLYDFIPDGGRRLLRTPARRRAVRRGGISGRVGARRRGLFHDEPFPVAAALHPADRRVRHIRRELDAAWEDGGVFQLTMHPHISGYRSRIWTLEELIRHAKAKGDVWFATHAQVVEWARDHAA